VLVNDPPRAGEPGLRQRKKQQTTQLIADTAWRLFIDRGFDAVTVAEVAREADVSEGTVFNYFPTKEDLFYARMEAFEADLLEAVRERAPGESFLTAFGRFVLGMLEARGLLASTDKETADRLVAVTRVITASPALLAREQQIFNRYTASLAALMSKETGAAEGDVEPWVAANALIGVHRGLLDYTRRRVLAGVRNPRLGREVRRQGESALALLREGLGQYGAESAQKPLTGSGGGSRGEAL
jgi:AcrR family transcriptional regulator